MQIKNAILLLTIIISSFAHALYDPTEHLISAYCSNIGPHMQSALNQTAQLKNTAQMLKDSKTSCAEIYTSSQKLIQSLESFDQFQQHRDSIGTIEQQISTVSQDVELERARLTERHIDQYRLANPSATSNDIENEILTFIPDSQLLYSLQTSLAELSVRKIDLQVQGADFNISTRESEKIQKLQIIQNDMTSLFSTIDQSSECMHSNSGIVTQLSSQVLAAASSLFSGVTGGIMSLGASLLSSSSKLLKTMSLNANLRDIENSQLQYALGCSLEGIAKTYCQARDTQTILKYSLKNHSESQLPDCPECNTLKNGFNLLTKELNVFNKWLSKIISGSDPNSPAQAQQRTGAYKLRLKLQATKEYLTGLMNEAQNDIGKLTGDQDTRALQEVNIRKQLMSTISEIIASSSGTGSMNCSNGNCTGSELGPYKDAFIDDNECGAWVYIYSNSIARVAVGRESTTTCQKYVTDKYSDVLTVAQIKALVDRINIEGDTFVAFQIQRVSEENPDKVMVDLDSVDSTYKVSPRDFLENAKEYFKNFQDQLQNQRNTRYLIKLIQRSAVQIDRAIEVVNKTDCNNSTPDEPCDLASEQLTELSTILAPNQQLLSVENALRKIFDEHINISIESNVISDNDLRFLLTTSSESSADTLLRHHLTVQRLSSDASSAKVTIEANLKNFANMFERNIMNSLSSLYKQLKRDRGNLDLKRVLGERCVQFLLIPDSSNVLKKFFKYKKFKKICKGRSYKSEFNSDVPSISFDKMVKTPFRKRVCKVYDFQRELNLRQNN